MQEGAQWGYILLDGCCDEPVALMVYGVVWADGGVLHARACSEVFCLVKMQPEPDSLK